MFNFEKELKKKDSTNVGANLLETKKSKYSCSN